MKNIFIIFVFLFFIYSCKENSQPGNQNNEGKQVKRIVEKMDVKISPDPLVFVKADSIPIIINCTYKDSAFCCGSGEIYYNINARIDIEKVYSGRPYHYHHAACGDTIYLKNLSEGGHTINGCLLWNKGDWSFSKYWTRKIKIH